MTPQQILSRLREQERVILAGPSGKDSLLCMHLLLEAGIGIECAFRRDIPDGLPCEEEQTVLWMEQARAKYGKLVGKLHGFLGEDPALNVARGAYRLMTHGEHREIVAYGRSGWEDAVRRATGLDWVVDGTRVDEMQVSFQAANMRRMRGWFAEARKAHPIWNMRIRDVWAELAQRGYPASSIEATGGGRTRAGTCGFGLIDGPLWWLYKRCKHTPTCLSRLAAHYPDIVCLPFRREIYGSQAWERQHSSLRGYRLHRQRQRL